MSNNELTAKIKELRELQSLVEEANAEIESLKDSIKAYMGDTEELRAGEYKVTWKPVSTVRLDTAALKKALPDVYQAFARTPNTRRFVIV